MNESYEIVETYLDFPTEFSLIVSDNLGFTQAYVSIPCEKNPIQMPYSYSINIAGKSYSVFILLYTFKHCCTNNVAQIYFIANGIRYDYDKIYYNVTR